MKKVIRLTESDLIKIVNRVIKEQSSAGYLKIWNTQVVPNVGRFNDKFGQLDTDGKGFFRLEGTSENPVLTFGPNNVGDVMKVKLYFNNDGFIVYSANGVVSQIKDGKTALDKFIEACKKTFPTYFKNKSF